MPKTVADGIVMPGKLKVRVMAGRDLPVMDRATDLTDAFVEVKFGSTSYKTDVYRKSLYPQWNSEWYRFEVDDEDLQDEPLQIRVLDHDTYSAHDAIGRVYVDLNPLLTKDKSAMISGWFPIYDTMHGIRGELQVIVKVDLFSDFNKFRQSSVGVQFLCTPGVPQGYTISGMLGFVEELVVNDDPEYQWIDKIRSMRASNEARQILFSKLSGQLQRKIGLKVLEMGGNAVIGYRQCFDLEGESGIVVRAIGTSVTLSKDCSLGPTTPLHSGSPGRDLLPPEDNVAMATPSSPTNCTAPALIRTEVSPAKPGVIPRRSSASDIDTPPKAGSTSSGSGGGMGGSSFSSKPTPQKPVLQQHSIDLLEYPFFTMKSFPPGFLVHLGGVVSARSVKLLDRIHNPDEPETRDAWWIELRTEIRSHARAMGCHAVVGYVENTSICEEIIILSASGTAAIVNPQMAPQPTTTLLTMSLDRTQFSQEKEREKDKVEKDGQDGTKRLHVDVNLANSMADGASPHQSHPSEITVQCSLCHVPYSEGSLPFPVHLSRCHVCRRHKVPDILFTTLEPPTELPVIGKGCFVQARICRLKKEAKGEINAKEISDGLPFMEYELHNQLLNKLKVKAMNSLFGLKIQFSAGERLLVAVASGTALYTAALPAPPLPKILGKENSSVGDLQKRVLDMISRNKDHYNLHVPEFLSLDHSPRPLPALDDSEDDPSGHDLELGAGNKDTFILEVDDAADAQLVSVLLDTAIPDGFDVCNTENVPGMRNVVTNLQMFTRVWRGQLNVYTNKAFSNQLEVILRSLYFKMRGQVPCALCSLDFDIDLPEEDEIQIAITGMCVGLGEPQTLSNGLVGLCPPSKDGQRHISGDGCQSTHEEMMFPMDIPSTEPPTSTTTRHPSSVTPKEKKEKKIRYHCGVRHKIGVELSPMSYIPGARIDSYLGHLNFFMIRETTSVRDEGGLNGFMHSFVGEVLAICRAHVSAIGGNALVSYQMTQCVLEDNRHKNQGQCLINVCGDVVHVQYDADTDLVTCKTGSAGSIKTASVSPLPPGYQKLTPRDSSQTSSTQPLKATSPIS